MKFIAKDLRNEPKTLIEYRATPFASYSGFVDTDKILKSALCKEQGYICCYCMRSIDENSMSVEHYITQKRHETSPLSEEAHRDNDLQYANMLASCNSKERNCSGERGNKPLTINPLNKNIETLVYFKNEKYICATSQSKADVEDILKLTNDIRLEDARKEVLEKVRKNLPNNRKSWTKAVLHSELNKWKSIDKQGKFRPFCQVAICYLQGKLKKVY